MHSPRASHALLHSATVAPSQWARRTAQYSLCAPRNRRESQADALRKGPRVRPRNVIANRTKNKPTQPHAQWPPKRATVNERRALIRLRLRCSPACPHPRRRSPLPPGDSRGLPAEPGGSARCYANRYGSSAATRLEDAPNRTSTFFGNLPSAAAIPETRSPIKEIACRWTGSSKTGSIISLAVCVGGFHSTEG